MPTPASSSVTAPPIARSSSTEPAIGEPKPGMALASSRRCARRRRRPPSAAPGPTAYETKYARVSQRERLEDAAHLQQQLPAPRLRRHRDHRQEGREREPGEARRRGGCRRTCRCRSSRRCRATASAVTTSVAPTRNERLLSSPRPRGSGASRRNAADRPARCSCGAAGSRRGLRHRPSTKRMRSAATSARTTASSRRRADGEHRAGPVGRAAQRPELVAGLAVEPRLHDAVQALRHLDRLEHAGRRDEEARHRAADARARRLRVTSAASAARRAPPRARARSGRRRSRA